MNDDCSMRIKFNQVLQERLGSQNLSEVSRDTGIPKSLIHDWVSTKRLPSLKNLAHVKTLANFLGLSLEELIFGNEDSNHTISSVSFEDSGRKYQVNIKRIK